MPGKTAIIILAAGNSSRLGSPKQLLDVHGTKLLEHVVLQAWESQADEVFVVLGFQENALKTLLSGHSITVINNKEWHKGMGSSIKAGIHAVKEKGEYQSVIISVCDQPYLTPLIFDQLISDTNDHEIIASAYSDGNFGPPTLFKASQFDDLLKINDSAGARSLIKDYKGHLGLTPFRNGEIDMDTIEDYEKFLQTTK